jgi:uncharacterized protein YlxW (UPF0749 family)
MAAHGKIGNPVPLGVVGDKDAPAADEALEATAENLAEDSRFAAESQQELAAIKEELARLSQSVSQLTEATASYARLRVERAAHSAIDRYPIGSMVTAALVGFFLAGHYRR